MRHTLFLIIIALMMSVFLAPQAVADEKCEEVQIRVNIDQSGGDADRDREHRHDGEGPHFMDGECPMGPPMQGMGWFDRPWDFWRHVQMDSLDFDAVHFMSNVRKIVILPFVDMTIPTLAGHTKLAEAGGPHRIVDNLAAEFMRWGYLVVPPPDVEAFFNMYVYGEGYRRLDSEANNDFWFRNIPDRAMDFYIDEVPGLRSHREGLNQANTWLSREDIMSIAEVLEADCVVRGYINEYAVSRDIDGDWRTFVPPFLGLLNPDRRVTMEVAYYLYDGNSGELVWNGTVDIQNDTNWPMFTSDAELIQDTEDMAAWQMTGHVLPGWMNIVRGHPEWIPFRMWDRGCEGRMGMEFNRPDWLNPMRMGWHEEYYRDDIKVNIEPDPSPPERLWYRDVGPSYNGLRRYLGEE